MSKYLNKKQLSGLKKTGDIMIPPHGMLPAFSATSASLEIDRVLDYAEPFDRKDFALLMGVFHHLPKFGVFWIIKVSTWHRYFPGPIAAALRFLEVGLKGVVFTLYYAQTEVLELIGWDAQINTSHIVNGGSLETDRYITSVGSSTSHANGIRND